MGRFRYRPVEVDAVEWTGANWAEIVLFLEDVPGHGRVRHDPDSHGMLVDTARGQERAVQGDWLVRDDSGRYALVAPSHFAAEFEEVPGVLEGR